MTEEVFNQRKRLISNEWIKVYGEEISLDGYFTLEELKQIVALFEEYLSDKS